MRFIGDYPQDCGENIDFSDLAFDSFCNRRCGQPLVDLFFTCGMADEAATLVYSCRVNENGITCGTILGAVAADATAAENVCLPPSTPCSTACQNALQDLRDTGGCCANLTEVGSQFNIDVALYNFTLWESCDVEVTGLCTEGPLSGSGKALMAAKIPFIGLVIMVLAVLLL